MAHLNETDRWEEGIYQLEEDDPVLGGPTGIDNLAPRQLASRTRYLRVRGVTPWAAALPYPADSAYVAHNGSTWKSVAASTGVAPGTDPAKGVRWGHTADQLKSTLGDAVAAHEASANPHPQYATDLDLAAHRANADPHAGYAPWTALQTLIEGAGIVADRATLTQALQAVRRFAGGNVRTVAAGATVLTADDAGLVLVNAAAGAVSITLPLAANLKALGITFRRIDAVPANAVTIQRAGTNTIDEGATFFTLLSRADVRKVVSDGVSAWRSEIGPISTSFGSNGYTRLPSGLILQWGYVVTNGSGVANIVLPIAFPNHLYRSIVNPVGGNNNTGNQLAQSLSAFSFNIVNASTQSLAPGAVVGFYSIGD